MSDRWRTAFRSLVVGGWLLTAATVMGSVPPEIQERANQSFARDATPFLLFLGIACSLGGLKIAAEIGLFLFKGWARPLFVALALAGVVVPFAVTLLPAEISGMPNRPLEQSLAVLLSMADGAIIALAYGSPVAALFTRPGVLGSPSAQDAG